MLDPLQVTDIQPNGSGILVKIRSGGDRIFKIASQGKILIRHKIINTDELRVGDEILAYGLDHAPAVEYNGSSRKRVKSRSSKEIKSNGKRDT